MAANLVLNKASKCYLIRVDKSSNHVFSYDNGLQHVCAKWLPAHALSKSAG